MGQEARIDGILGRIKEWCEEDGIAHVAALAGIDRANLQNILVGRRKPGRLTLSRLEAALTRKGASPIP